MLVGGEGIYSKVAKQVSGGKLKTYDMGARGIRSSPKHNIPLKQCKVGLGNR